MKGQLETRAGKIYRWLDSDLAKRDYVLLFIIYAFLFLSFTFPDIIITGNRSFIMQEHPLAFYQKSMEITGDMGANYLPSTFWIYAIWNLPLRWVGSVPDFASPYCYSLVRTVWYRIPPLVCFAICARYIEKIALHCGMGKKKAKLCRYLFLVFPAGLFSQFIFSQYDIFTTCLMVIGFYCYLKDDFKAFVLSFGFAITFKYQALVYFLVLYVLKEKRVFRIIASSVLVLIPAVLETLIYIRYDAFRSQVLGFNALTYTNSALNLGGVGSVNVFLLFLIFVLIYSYITKADERNIARYSVFFMNGVGLAFYGFATFNPQWIMLIVPFEVLAIMMSTKAKFMLLLEDLFIVVFYVFCVNFYISVDQNTLGFMVWNRVVEGAGWNWPISMANLYVFSDISFLYTIMLGVLGAFFWLSHPKYAQEINVIDADVNLNARAMPVVATLAWAAPAYMCLWALVKQAASLV